ncbi:6397_t:CDS:2 [Ambispora leptoticha]|uniref:6397_t:CDS:1 n=1 Tax=Ambispora leptoticha TaxID=144679 RepID=A0A9N9F9G9_9GLOM|nr:6397_t:CDS:2 [Ambispora leptoticha]
MRITDTTAQQITLPLSMVSAIERSSQFQMLLRMSSPGKFMVNRKYEILNRKLFVVTVTSDCEYSF